MFDQRKPMLNLKIMRIRRGLTQVELSERIGVSQNTISFYEIGKRYPSYKILCKLAEVLNCEIKDIA